MPNINDRIKELRTKNEKSQREVAAAIGVMPNTYSGYETGRRTVPGDMIRNLSRFYNVSADYILGLEDLPYCLNADEDDDASRIAAMYKTLSPEDKASIRERIIVFMERSDDGVSRDKRKA